MKTPNKKRNDKLRRLLITVGVAVGLVILMYLLIQSRHTFTRRGVRQMEHLITSYGSWSPLVIIILMFLSTVIPPLPLPIPLIEIASGLIFGFWKGLAIVWISHLISSLSAFYMAKFIKKSYLRKILENNVVSLYKKYLNTHGPLAIIITRATMSAPFNVISFLAGISKINVWIFSGATAIGTIPEAILYTTVGVIFKNHHFRLLYVFILTLMTALLGPVISYFMIRYIQNNKLTSNKPPKTHRSAH